MKIKRVLFIHIDFYEYNQRIADELHELGYEVDCFCQDIKINLFEKIVEKFCSGYFFSKNIKKQNDFINNIVCGFRKYDFVFVIKGEKLDNYFLDRLRKSNPQACFILYLWDDVARISNFFMNYKYYDRVFSFDRKDAEQYGMSFLPLFFCNDFRLNNTQKDIDVYFSGWDHSDRRKFIEKIITVLDKNNMKYYFHIFTGRWKTFKDKFKRFDLKRKPDYLKFKKLPLTKNAELTRKSKVIIDIQHPTQKGLTMRTVEALAAKAKLITTNEEVMNYDFYNPNNIQIVDRNNPIVYSSFFKSPYQELSEEIVEKYSLANWLKSLLQQK
jgi:hypothetical protein